MNLLKDKRPQVRLVGLMIGIALIALVLRGVVWFRSVQPVIQTRRHTAAAHKHWAQYWRQVAGWIDDPCLRAWRNPNRPGAYDEFSGGRFYDQRRPYVYTLAIDALPQNKARHEFVRCHRDEILALCCERVDYHERMSDRWAFAAWTPWSDPGPDEPLPPIETRTVDQTY